MHCLDVRTVGRISRIVSAVALKGAHARGRRGGHNLVAFEHTLGQHPFKKLNCLGYGADHLKARLKHARAQPQLRRGLAA